MNLKIGILGAESSGKSTLATALAEQLGGICVPEYAREYIGSLEREYTSDDVGLVARRQITQLSAAYPATFVFFDTELIITRVWFLHKYGYCPGFLTEALHRCPLDFCLLCAPDLPFVEDPLRENPHLRTYLFDWYRNELEHCRFPYAVVEGTGDTRTANALNALRTAFPHAMAKDAL